MAFTTAHRAVAMSAWDGDWVLRQACLSPLAPAVMMLGDYLKGTSAAWPLYECLNAVASQRELRNAAGLPLRFVKSTPKRLRRRASRSKTPEPTYEELVYNHGQVPTRHGHWHDLFNMLVWCTYPQTKAALNQRQILARQEAVDQKVRSGKQRSGEQNRLTMFDEGGVILAVTAQRSDALSEWLRQPRRYDCLQDGRTLPTDAGDMGVFIIGHAVMELMQSGTWDVTAMAHVLTVDSEFFALPLMSQVETVDRQTANLIATKAFAVEAPVPGFPISCLQRD